MKDSKMFNMVPADTLILGDNQYYSKDCYKTRLAGFVKQLKEESGESRLIHICNGRVETIMVIPKWVSEVTNMIVTDDYVYLGHDKMLSIIDRKTKAIEYRTFLSGKAVKNLLKNRYKK